MKLDQSLVTSIKSQGEFNTKSLTNNNNMNYMNCCITEKIKTTEKIIAQGVKRAQSIQTK